MRRENLTVGSFLAIFRPILVLYSLCALATLDWTFYDLFANTLYHPVGLAGIIGISWPGLALIKSLLIGAAVSGVAWLSGYFRSVASAGFTAVIFLLDALHNGFGFVDAQIHMVFFLIAACWMEYEAELPLFQSKAFRFCEVVFVLVYFQSGLSKLLDGGLAWALDGGTLQIGWLRQQAALGLALSGYATVAIGLSIAALTFELAFPLLYWFNERRPWLYVASAAFHVGIYFTMGIDFFHLWAFSLTMILVEVEWRKLYELIFARTRSWRPSRFLRRGEDSGLERPKVSSEL